MLNEPRRVAAANFAWGIEGVTGEDGPKAVEAAGREILRALCFTYHYALS